MSSPECVPIPPDLFEFTAQTYGAEAAVRLFRLLNYYARRGPIPKEELERVLTVSTDATGIDTQSEYKCQIGIDTQSGEIRIPYLDKWRTKRHRFIEKQRSNGSARWKKRAAGATSIDATGMHTQRRRNATGRDTRSVEEREKRLAAQAHARRAVSARWDRIRNARATAARSAIGALLSSPHTPYLSTLRRAGGIPPSPPLGAPTLDDMTLDRAHTSMASPLMAFLLNGELNTKPVAEAFLQPPVHFGVLPHAFGGGNGHSSHQRRKNGHSENVSQPRLTDARRDPFKELIERAFREVNEVGSCPWGKEEDRALAEFLKSHREVDDKMLYRMLWNRFNSEGAKITERPGRWISGLMSYFGAPLDRYGKQREARL